MNGKIDNNLSMRDPEGFKNRVKMGRIAQDRPCRSLFFPAWWTTMKIYVATRRNVCEVFSR